MTLIEYLEQSAEQLIERVLAEQYRDPFWYARYGERADRHGKEDGRFHIKYVVTALASDDAGVMTNYARWLQGLLTSHGMCTLHLDDNFRLFAEAIDAGGHPDRARAVAMFATAREALRYPEGPARLVQDRSAAIAQQLASSEYLVSYVADAIALGDPSKFRAHVDFLESRGPLSSTLGDLRTALAALVPGETMALLFD